MLMLVPVHVGHRRPDFGDQPDGDQARPRRRDWTQVRVSALDKVAIDWAHHEIEPRWIGSEAADCAAALQPSIFHSSGAEERRRFLAGAAGRGETALVVSMLGFTEDDTPRSVMQSSYGDSIYPGTGMDTVVYGTRLPLRTRVELTPNLTPTDQDLGKRLLNRPTDAPWWSLELSGSTSYPGAGGPPTTTSPIGQLQPILVDPLGKPLVAVWVAPDQRTRWYVIPDDIDWNVVLDWLVHRAIPSYVPEAARRHRSSSFVDPDLLTPDEHKGRQALADMEARHAEERRELEEALAEARRDAETIRDGLFYGTGSDLVQAVEAVLVAAGFEVIDL